MNTQDEIDLAVLHCLKELGSNLSKLHPIDFFLYFPTEELANSAASEIERDGYVVKLNLDTQPLRRRLFSKPEWSCCASKSIVPKTETILEISSWLESIAQRFSGKYDGWETEVTE